MTVTLPPPTYTSDSPDSPDLRVSLKRVAALYRISEAMMRADNEEHVLLIAAEGLVAQANYVNAWLATVDHAAHMLHGRVTAIAGENVKAFKTPTALSLDLPGGATQVARTGQPNVVLDAISMAEQQGWGDTARKLGLQAVLYIPFRLAGEVIGVIGVGTDCQMQPDEELTLLSLFATQLTTALVKAKYDVERAAQVAALQAASQAQERLLETVRELSTPAIPIYDGILVLPLVGNIDTGRASQVMEAVLNGIAREHASVVIVDVTGVPIIDTGVANHLVQVTQAAQLLGARCMLVGIKPEVAQTLVQLGVDLSSIVTRSDLQAGVAFALEKRGLRIVSSRN